MTFAGNASKGESKANREKAGLIIKKYRVAAGLTQRELADAVGQKYYTFISQVEGGHARIPSQDYKLWAKALGVNPKELVMALLPYYDPYTYRILFK